MLKRVTLLLLSSILVVTCSLDAYSLLYTDQEVESDVKIYFVAVKYYDPHVGRFISRDPVGDGVNWYAYARNNPLAFIDPLGLRALSALETSVVNFAFQGSVDPSELDLEIVPGLSHRGLYTIGTGNIQIRANVFEAAGLSENSTVANTDVLNSAVLDYLSILIHEVTHYWQDKNSLYTKNRLSPNNDESVYTFNFDQLTSLTLGKEQHASAVAVSFILSWQLSHGASAINLSMPALSRFAFNGLENNLPFGPSVRSVWGHSVSRPVAASLLWFFKPLTNQLLNPVPGPLTAVLLGGIK